MLMLNISINLLLTSQYINYHDNRCIDILITAFTEIWNRVINTKNNFFLI
jgi:hypothetical protein